MIRTQGNDFRKDFATFDACFPLLAADMVPPFLHPFVPPIAKGMNGREHLFEFIATWVEDGMPGLDEGVILDMAQIGLTKGHSSREIASFLNADLWALQANTPNAAGALLLYIIQSTLLPVVREEINHIPTKIDSSMPDLDTKALASMEMVSSCVQETLRLNTSSYSIRVVEESFILRTSVIRDVNDAPPPGYLIQRGSRIVCATRAAHISDAIWGSNPSIWDGTRFLEREDDEARMKSKKAREMRGFGGGISIVCPFLSFIFNGCIY
jgi:cytochrome P450